MIILSSDTDEIIILFIYFSFISIYVKELILIVYLSIIPLYLKFN